MEREEVMDAKKDSVQGFLDQYARALTSGDTVRLGTMWEMPALVIGDEMSRPLASREEVERFFGGAKSDYERRGIADTRAQIESVGWCTERIAIVSVRWPHLDEGRKEVGAENTTYVLRRNDAGELKILVTIVETSAPPATH